MKKLLQNEWFWMFGAVILFNGGLILFGFLSDNFEGIGSIALLISAVILLFKGGKKVVENKYQFIFYILVFAVLGLMFDRAGNPIYNKPLMIFCPSETILKREVVSQEDYDGNLVNHQYFFCISEATGKTIKQFPLYQTVLFRFIEYILIGSVLLGLNWLICGILRRKR